LSDAIVCHSVLFEPKKNSERISSPSSPYDGAYGIANNPTHVRIHEVKVSITFFQLLNNAEQYEHRIFLFPNGVKSGKFHEITNTHKKKNIVNNGMVTGVSAVFKIPVSYRHLISYKSEVVYAAQLNITSGGNLKFPYERGGKERYMGAKIRLRIIQNLFQSEDQEKNLKNLPLSELLDKNTWK